MPEVKESLFIIILAMLLAGLVLSGLTDAVLSLADTSVPNNEATISISKASNSSAGATITITMYTVTHE